MPQGRCRTPSIEGRTTSRTKAALVDSQRANSRFERGAWHSEAGGRARGAIDPPARRAQGVFDYRLLLRDESARQLERAVDRTPRREPALVNRELVRLTHDHRPLDDVLQLTDVSGPWIRLKAVKSLLVHVPNRLPRLPRIPRNQVPNEERDVFRSLSKRRDVDGKHAQSVEQILAKSSL